MGCFTSQENGLVIIKYTVETQVCIVETCYDVSSILKVGLIEIVTLE